MKIKYQLEQIHSGIFHCVIEDMYDLTMTFCRVQEFYESPFKNIRGKKFKLLDFMAQYSRNRGCFSYPVEWGGFNVPGKVVERLYELGIDDYNDYDRTIDEIRNKIKQETKSNYYLIASDGNGQTIDHELCHGLFYLDRKYKKSALEILKKLNKSVYRKAEKALLEHGYCKAVIPDELQAYFTTGHDFINEVVHFDKREEANIQVVTKLMEENFSLYAAGSGTF